MTIEITRDVAQRVLDTIDAGLVSGVGKPVPGQMCVEAAVCYAMGLPHGDEPDCVSPALRALKIGLNDSGWSTDKARARGLRRLGLIQLGSKNALNDTQFSRSLSRLVIGVIVPRALRSAARLFSGEAGSSLEAAAVRCARTPTKKSAADAAYAANAAAYAANAANAAEAATYAASASEAAASAAEAAAEAEAAASGQTDAAYAAAASAASAAEAAWIANAARAAYDAELGFFAEEVVKLLVNLGVPGAQWLVLAPVEEDI